jgi:hypothetical protein
MTVPLSFSPDGILRYITAAGREETSSVQEVARWVALTPPGSSPLAPRTAGVSPRAEPRRTDPPPMPPLLAIPLRLAPRVPTPPARRPDPPPPPTPLAFQPRPVRRVCPPPDSFRRRSARLAVDSAGAAQSRLSTLPPIFLIRPRLELVCLLDLLPTLHHGFMLFHQISRPHL